MRRRTKDIRTTSPEERLPAHEKMRSASAVGRLASARFESLMEKTRLQKKTFVLQREVQTLRLIVREQQQELEATRVAMAQSHPTVDLPCAVRPRLFIPGSCLALRCPCQPSLVPRSGTSILARSQG